MIGYGVSGIRLQLAFGLALGVCLAQEALQMGL